jgi:hypothetical protein
MRKQWSKGSKLDKNTALKQAAEAFAKNFDATFLAIAKFNESDAQRLYRIFPNGKDEIILLIIRNFWAGFLKVLETVKLQETEAGSRLKMIVNCFFTYVLVNRNEFSVVNSLSLVLSAKYEDKPELKTLQAEIDNLHTSIYRELISIIRQGQDVGEITRKVTAPVICRMLVGAGGSALLKFFFPEDLPEDKIFEDPTIAKQMVDFFIKGLVEKPGTQLKLAID